MRKSEDCVVNDVKDSLRMKSYRPSEQFFNKNCPKELPLKLLKRETKPVTEETDKVFPWANFLAPPFLLSYFFQSNSNINCPSFSL